MNPGDRYQEVGAGAAARIRARLAEAAQGEAALFAVWAEVDSVYRPIDVIGPAPLCEHALTAIDELASRLEPGHDLRVHLSHICPNPFA